MPRIIPKAKGMVPPKEVPEFMIEKLQMEINRKKQTYKSKTNKPQKGTPQF